MGMTTNVMPRPVLYNVVLPLRSLRHYREARRNMSQLCKRCGRDQNEVDFTVSSQTWEKVVPARWKDRIVCLACFDELAAERGIETVKVFLVNGP